MDMMQGFNFGYDNRKGLVIVHDEKTESYANYLRGLVSQNDDRGDMIVGTKDGEVDVVILTEKQYQQTKPTLSNDHWLLFIGNSKYMKADRGHFDIKYNQYGMVFGSIGRQACLYVDHIVPMKEYEDFINMAQKIQDDVKKVTVGVADVAQVVAGAAAGAGVELGTAFVCAATILATGVFMPVVALGIPAVLAGGGVGALKYNAKKKEIERQQYDCLVLKCYLDYLNDFMK